MSGNSRHRLAPILTEASSWTSDQSAQHARTGDSGDHTTPASGQRPSTGGGLLGFKSTAWRCRRVPCVRHAGCTSSTQCVGPGDEYDNWQNGFSGKVAALGAGITCHSRSARIVRPVIANSASALGGLCKKSRIVLRGSSIAGSSFLSDDINPARNECFGVISLFSGN
jgi:hypothetical protein